MTLLGTDVLIGAVMTLRVKDPGAVVKSQGGAAGALAYKFAPAAVENKMYDEMGRQIVEQMKQRGIDAESGVARVPGEPAQSNFLRGAAIGAGGIALGYGLFRLLFR